MKAQIGLSVNGGKVKLGANVDGREIKLDFQASPEQLESIVLALLDGLSSALSQSESQGN